MSDKQLDPGAKRNLRVLAIVFGLAVAGAIAGYLLLGKREHVAQSNIANEGPRGTLDNGEVSPRYAREVKEQEKDNAHKAEAKGESYVPDLVTPTPEQSAPVAETKPAKPAEAPQEPTQRLVALTEDDLKLIRGWQSEIWSITPKKNETFAYVGSKRVGGDSAQGGGAAASSSTATAGSSSRSKNPMPAIDNPIMAAILQQSLDTDEQGAIVRVKVVGHTPWAGAILKGASIRNDERITATFDSAWYRGEWHKISAVAIDPDDNRSTLSGSVDHRYLQRYVLPVLADAATIYGQALAIDGSSQTSNINGVTNTVSITPQTAAIMAGAAGLNRINQQVQQQASNTNIRVERSANLIAVMILDAGDSSMNDPAVGRTQAASGAECADCTQRSKPNPQQAAQEAGQPQRVGMQTAIGVPGPYGTTIGVGGTVTR